MNRATIAAIFAALFFCVFWSPDSASASTADKTLDAAATAFAKGDTARSRGLFRKVSKDTTLKLKVAKAMACYGMAFTFYEENIKTANEWFGKSRKRTEQLTKQEKEQFGKLISKHAEAFRINVFDYDIEELRTEVIEWMADSFVERAEIYHAVNNKRMIGSLLYDLKGLSDIRRDIPSEGRNF